MLLPLGRGAERPVPLRLRRSKIAHSAMDNDLTLKQAALKLGFVTEAEFDRIVDPRSVDPARTDA